MDLNILSGLGLSSAADLIATKDEAEIHRLQVLAYTDGLTGLMNRRSFDVLAPSHSDAAFIFVDLDDLKAKNHSLGHLVSNDLLRVVGQTLDRHMKRADDRAFRLGGDEFIAILPNCSPEYAATVAEDVRREVEAHGGCTVSIGVAQGKSCWRSLFESGDQAAKEAKAQGKNRVVVCEDC
jgi:diguanylate cyclase (GGDEF)-like protein